jgi:diguanylate cyclase (GGDEF)-like protein/PAS domain S-box-containing protein
MAAEIAFGEDAPLIEAAPPPAPSFFPASGEELLQAFRVNSERLYRTIVELSPDAVAVTALDGKLLTVNARSIELYAFPDGSSPIGRSVMEFVAEENWSRAEGELLKLMFTREPHCAEYRLKRADGTLFWGEVNAKLIPDDRGYPSLILIITRDVTERKRIEEELRLLAIVDDLTGLYNRRGFKLAAEQEMKHARRNGHGLALLFLDIDSLKSINDSLGHCQGDAALEIVATLLKRSFRDSDIIARWGGDEFVVLGLDIPAGCVESFIERFSDNLAQHNRRGDYPFKLSLSMGLSCWDPASAAALEELVRRADLDMYSNKRGKTPREGR